MPLPAVLAAALVLLSPAAANATTPEEQRPVQWISIQAVAGDSSVSGVADLAVTREHGGFRLSGYVRADRGCLELKTVNMHLGMYVGGTWSAGPAAMASRSRWTPGRTTRTSY